MPQSTASEFSLFEEIYGSYFQAVRRILEAGHDTPLTLTALYQLVRSCAFEESAAAIVPKLTDGPWSPLLEKTEDGNKNKGKCWKSRLKHASLKTPLTSLQKAWLKSLLADSRFRLFFTDSQLERLTGKLSGTSALFDPEDFYYFDRYADGDPYEKPGYRENFQIILRAMRERKPLFAAYAGGKGRHMTPEVLPCRLQYSPKDDKFRLLGVTVRHGRTSLPVVLNLGRIERCHLSRNPVPERFDWIYPGFASQCEDPVRIRIANERNALERCMLHFSNYEKQTVYEPDTDTWICSLYYDPADETELLIELLSFGPVIRILGPERFLSQVRERVKRQHELLRFC